MTIFKKLCQPVNFPSLARQCDDGAENEEEFGLHHMLTMMMAMMVMTMVMMTMMITTNL